MWATLATFDVHSKVSGVDAAATAARPVLEHGLAVYRGEEQDQRWQGLPVEDYVAYVVEQIPR